MEVISGEKIVKSYGKFKVLKGINLNVQDGEFVGIMGKSGSGKTTLLKILGLIESVTDGALLYKKDEISKLSDKELARIRREELGFVFQEFYLMDSLDVFENIMLPFYISKTVDDAKKERARMLMDQFGIRLLEKKMPTELSGGERQRVAICRALINDPEIIFADEPTGNLDSKSGKVVIEALREINKKMNKTIVMVTHDPQMASWCDRIVLLKDGRIINELKKKNVSFLTTTTATLMDGSKLYVKIGEMTLFVSADTVIWAGGGEPVVDTELTMWLMDERMSYAVVGDANEIGDGGTAIKDAYELYTHLYLA